MNIEEIRKKLADFGMNLNEIEIYLAVLKLKNATVSEIAKAAGIKRTSVYYCLENLIEKNLVFRLIKNDNKYYCPENPSESLYNLIHEKETIIKSVLPELKNLFGSNPGQPEIKMYRKIEGLRQMYLDILHSKEKLVRYYLSSANLEELLGKEFVDEFVKKRIEKKITSLALRSFDYKPEREQGTTHAKQYREVRFMPEGMQNVKPYIAIYDNKVAVISTPEEKLGFIIESKEFADAQKTIFDMLWNTVAI